MKTNILIKYVVLFFLFLSCNSQGKRIEDIYQECAYNTLSDKGKSLKKYAKDYEKFLISINVLKDSSAKSYYELFTSLSKGKIYNTDNYLYSFRDSINLNKTDRFKIFPRSIECSKKIVTHNDYSEYKKKLNELIPSDTNKIKEGLINYSNSLKVEDFELDFYKLQTFIFMDLTYFIFNE